MKKYSKIGLFKSKGRIFKESLSKYRTPFQRDRDRIIHSASFRRLKHKTQVFVNTEGDHYRTRITHSMEVAQIARSIARYLNLNEDLAETLSLAHDLGHTPFGHAGEDSLDECMQDHGGFDHNLQTLRIIMFLENKYLKFNGLNLSIETLEGLLKHNGPVDNLNLVDDLIGIKNFKGMINFNTYPSIEAQISAISDDIAYNNHDIQDGINANLFKLEELVEIDFFRDIYKKYKKKINKQNYKVATYQIIRDSIDQMIKDLINNTKINLKSNNIKTLKDINKTRKSPEFTKLQKDLKAYELKQLELMNANKLKTYQDLLSHLETNDDDNLIINKDIFKALHTPLYAGNNDELLECVVMLELIAKIDPPTSDKALRQKLSLEMLQNKFSGKSISNDEIKNLIIKFINNLQSKEINNDELKLWDRMNGVFKKIINQLP